MANNSYSVSTGDDLYRVAAILYGDSSAWTLLARANGLYDPVIQADQVLSVPNFNSNWANDGILASK